jgi:nucleoside-diphosphate-sugar epimerase
MAEHADLPDVVRTEEELEELLSRPAPAVVEMMRGLSGDLLVLGGGGKVGVSLCRTARRAMEAAGVDKRVIAVDLFPEGPARELLESYGCETITCDLLDRDAVAKLPDAEHVIFMAGRKFGTQGAIELTWAINVLVPANAVHRYRNSRIVVFSTGCVYPLVDAASGGCTEDILPDPRGDYAMSCLGRERVFAHTSQADGTRVCLFRLNYAIECRYGVLHDIGMQVWNNEPVNRSVGQFNALWQGDVNNQALLSLDLCRSPADVINVTGPEMLSTTWAAEAFGRLMDREVTYAGDPGPIGYLSNAARATELFGFPTVSPKTILRWTAEWIKAGGKDLGKPTHFEVSDGKF